MELKKYLDSHCNWKDELQSAPYNLIIKEDIIDGITYYLFKYNQYDSDMSLKIAQEARGCIFTYDEHRKEWICVSRPFDKFFNYGEENAAEIKWDSAYVSEKIDGSLIKIWWWNGWHVSTNGTIDARKAQLNGNPNKSYFDLFEQALNCKVEELWKVLNYNIDYYNQLTIMFELVSPEARLVVPYEKTELYYLVSRDIDDGLYIDDISFLEEIDHCTNIHINSPKLYNLNSLEDCIKVANTFGNDKEGFVVADTFGNRIKIKGQEYLNAFHYRCNNIITTKKVIEMMKDDVLDDFSAYCTDWSWKIEEVKKAIKELSNHYEDVWHNIVSIAEKKGLDKSDRKGLALLIKEQGGDAKNYCYHNLSNYCGGVEFLMEVIPTSKLVNLIK